VDLSNKPFIIIDDGIATGNTINAYLSWHFYTMPLNVSTWLFTEDLKFSSHVMFKFPEVGVSLNQV
jgi:hypothetical protein